MTFFNFDHTDVLSARAKEWRERAYHVALEYAEKPSGWLVLLSGRARDRTHLMAAIANKRRDLGESPLLVRVRDLLDFLRHSMTAEGNNDYYSRKQAMRAYPFLLLDELEIGAGSEYSRNELYDLLYWRQLARLPTVVSSPNENNQLLSDPGWRRLARLLMVPDYCTEVLVGEAPPEEQAGASAPRPASTRGRKPRS
jgi:DNA replication protein DnaC